MTGYYTEAQRALQVEHDTVKLADMLDERIILDELDERAIGFISSRDFFFLSTVTGTGEPTVSYKGGGVGVVQVLDPTTLLFPSYDGNGMYLSMGNIAETGKIGMLFIDFERPDRVRVQATATLSTEADDLARFPGAQMVVRAEVDQAWINCGRYVHKHTRVEDSQYVPDANGDAPVAAWKRMDVMQPVLSESAQAEVAEAGGTIDAEEYARRRAAGEA